MSLSQKSYRQLKDAQGGELFTPKPRRRTWEEGILWWGKRIREESRGFDKKTLYA